jgi:hypothetical protein
MGLRDDKKNVFTTISSYTSMIQSVQATDTTNIFPSINNKKDIVPFLLDTMKVILGTDALQQTVGELFTKFADNIEPVLKEAVKKQMTQFNANDPLPNSFTTGSGISVNVKDIDIAGKLKTNPSSQGGNLLYDTVNVNFDSRAYDAIQNGTSTFGVLKMTYNSGTDKLYFMPTNNSLKIGEWTNNYVDSITIINKKEFMTNVMNKIFGSVTKSQKKTADEVLQELIVDKLIDQMINDDDSFEISDEDMTALQAKADEMIKGIMTYDMGCGTLIASLPLSGLSELISSISGSTDAFYVGNQIDAVINDSIANQEVADENKQTIKDGFFQRLIRFITQELAKLMSTSPQIRALLAIVSGFVNGGIPQIGKAKDDLKKFKTIISCNIKAAMKLINEYIYNMAIKALVRFLKPVILKIIKEKINQYSQIIKSLTGNLTG